MLRACKESIQSASRNEEALLSSDGRHVDLYVHTTPVALDHESLKSLKVPIYNMVFAKRFLSAGTKPGVESLIRALECFYDKYIPLRAALFQAAALREDSQHALRESIKVVSVASSLSASVKIPVGCDASCVKKVAAHAMRQVEHLARMGVALPAMNVEHVRQAIDAAGLHLLANPPAPDPGARIRWSEKAMGIQLVALPNFSTALKGIAHSIRSQDLSCFNVKNAVPSTEFIRLMGAVMWVVQPDCTNSPTWDEVKLFLADTSKFVERLESWTPMRDVSASKSARAQIILLGIWAWVADGCNGNLTLSLLFAWVSLAVAITPLVDMAQRLTPVYKAIKQGITKVERAPANRQKLVTSRAWTRALFLLDGPGENWWWIKLIRPAASMDTPWVDEDDGGVGASHGSDTGVDNNQRNSDSKDSLQEDSVTKIVNQSLLEDEPDEEDFQESGDEHVSEAEEENEEVQTANERSVESPDVPDAIDKLISAESKDLEHRASPIPPGDVERSLTPSAEIPGEGEVLGDMELPSAEA
jgi:hypothetical protein